MYSLGIFALPSFPLDTIDFYVAVLLISCFVLMGFGNVLNVPLMGRSQGFMTTRSSRRIKQVRLEMDVGLRRT
ncbi:hypothetical protein TrLO_g9828 [Triparma laevis f. longispina]|uniref:Uncharacterized protein n=1 Tax=Triparma laevis f. longispina TaxID=1714387 RepID=A0A9W7FRR8_9STRA|nr:hypothetical protein TrLO_g9828 [Triparma laevis f. longispina]